MIQIFSSVYIQCKSILLQEHPEESVLSKLLTGLKYIHKSGKSQTGQKLISLSDILSFLVTIKNSEDQFLSHHELSNKPQ